MVKQFKRFAFAIVVSLLLPLAANAADFLLTLKVDSSTVGPDEFLLTLEIYGAPSDRPPDVTIEGFDQFQLSSQGRNLLQVPGGQTVKWILNYNLTPLQDGTFKVGPARARIEGRTYSSNALFITVKGTGKSAPEVKKPETKQQPEEPKTPLIRSAAEIGDKVLVLAETSRDTPYVHQGMTVTYRLLAQLPVDSLRFSDEADFPGFLKYDYPYVSRPTADRIRYRGEWYVA
ncbi:MAG TPA: BatD family protein, partial [Acidobacteriota bacterium]|nr:BatD family protein [Acidobacteriota bacterium]